LEKVAAHAATCHAYQSKALSLSADDAMLIFEHCCQGLGLLLSYKCRGCEETVSFAASAKIKILSGGNYWSCNIAVIWGQMATGGGFNHLEESMAIFGIPVMTKQAFIATGGIELSIQENSYHQGQLLWIQFGVSILTSIYIMHFLE